MIEDMLDLFLLASVGRRTLGILLAAAVIIGALCLIGYGIEQAAVRAWHFG